MSELALVIVEPLDGGVRLVNVVHEVELLAEDLAADGAAVAVLVAGRKVAQPKVPPHVALVPVPAESGGRVRIIGGRFGANQRCVLSHFDKNVNDEHNPNCNSNQ